MNALIIVLTVIDAMVALLLIGIVLIQQPKETSLGGSAFGGVGDSVFGGHAADHITKITVVLASIFLILTLVLAIITGHRTDDSTSLIDASAPEVLAPAPVKATQNVKKDNQAILHELAGKKKEAASKAVKVEKKSVKAVSDTAKKTEKALPEK